MAKYCVDCGKKVNKHSSFQIVHLCNKCDKKRMELNKKEAREERVHNKKVKSIIVKEYKIHTKIRELEKILRKPCMIEIHIANEDTYLFGRFVRRKFSIRPVSMNKKITQLKGEYTNIDDLCKKAKIIGFKVEMWSATEISLKYGGKRYNFLTDGIHEDIGRAGTFARLCGKKVAEIKYSLWGS